MSAEAQIYAIGTCAIGILTILIALYAMIYAIRDTSDERQATNNVKQTQFAECSNKRKFFYNKVLHKRAEFQTMKKQTQTKPIQTRSEFTPNLSPREGAEIPTGELLGILKPGTNQTQFLTQKPTCTPKITPKKHPFSAILDNPSLNYRPVLI